MNGDSYDLNEWEMNTSSYDWLVMAKSVKDFEILSNVLNATALRFDQNLVLGITDEQRSTYFGLCEQNFRYKENVRTWQNMNIPHNSRANLLSYSDSENMYSFDDEKEKTVRHYYRTTERFKNIARNRKFEELEKSWPLSRSGILSYNFSSTFDFLNISQFHLKSFVRKWSGLNNINKTSFNVYLIQCFKVRINSTLYVKYLGAWSIKRSMSLVDIPYPVEARNFLGEKFIVGRCNSSVEGSATALDDDGPSAPQLLDDILQFVALRLNATYLTRYYGKLGFRTYEGAWTGLLGALMDHSVDMALEPVTAIAPRHKDMDFIFPIADTICNIYIRHQETSAVRDIFLAPFSSKLIACVACMAIVAAVAVVIISRSSKSQGTRPITCIEGIIWSTGILCQQGGTWTPQTPAASILLIVCLFFALVTYNAYAAFITSVLSVRVASVSSLTDVLQSNLKIGYVRNGVDQMYLMSTKDVQLNAFYIRGYSEAENLVSSAEEGLVRAASQDYAFFAGQRVARSTLRSLSQARGRCDLRELPVQSTRAQLAFPLPSRSPYARPILVSLLQLRSGAVLSRLEAALVPAMPQCTPPSGFASARAEDVRTALFVILAGLLTGLLLGIGEYSWNNRSKYSRLFKKRFQRLLF
ncbi:probable glutamate receptor isoform X1 [Pararge aegeria]|uniref:probable glutamate receptor isoform X1 n=2 Tax=Pararge aegeria TaxID=116150 RepID=UPI0019CF4E21|nr:probable glutamate receptor isoform X1 [Pararge aegeria]